MTTTLRYKFRAETISTLVANDIYFKTKQEFPLSTSVLGELALDTFRYPSKGGLYWSTPDLCFPDLGVMALLRPTLQKPTEASKRLLEDDIFVLQETVKATVGYQFPFIIVEDEEYTVKMGDSGIANFIVFTELMEVLMELSN